MNQNYKAQGQARHLQTVYTNNGQTGYSTVPQGGLPQYTEAWALIEAARRMAEATTADDSKNAMREALRLNWRLWTIFQVELTGGQSTIPEELRMNMLNLCKYVDQHTVGALAEPTTKKVEILVNINRDIAGGLLDGLKKAVEDAEPEQPRERPGAQSRQSAPDDVLVTLDETA